MKAKSLLYIEVANSIKKNILDEVYPIGTQIPTENELEEKFKVSKITVRKAIEILANEGYLEKKSGKGTTVLSNRLFNKLSKAESFSRMVEKDGHRLTKEILAIEQVSFTDDEKELKRLFGNQAFKLIRLYRLNGEPYIYFEHYLPVLGDKQVLAQMEKVSLYKWLAGYGKNVERFKDSFEVTEIEEPLKKLLETEHNHLLKRIRRSYGQMNEMIEISYAIYDTSKYPYLIEYEV